MLSALVRAEAAPIRRVRPAPALDAARHAIEALLASWDDDLAAATFSTNVDTDEPMERRRIAIERLRDVHGVLRRSDEPPTSDTPLHAAWWLEGEPGRGRVKVEITLDPQPAPKVQWLELTSVPEPDPRWHGAAETLVASTNGETTELPMSGPSDGATAERDLLVVRTLFGAVRLRAPIASGASSVTYRVLAERGELDLALSFDADAHLLTAMWTPCTVRPPVFEVR
jgi:hypothetical protein